MPLISIITVNYNNVSGLKKTIESVLCQTFKDYEFLIIDGGSNDGSKEFLESNTSKIDFWLSEKDNGVYDAMNKGILHSNGEYLLFLNSGDFLVDCNVLENVSCKEMMADIIYGNVIWDDLGNHFRHQYPDLLSFEHFITKELPHQSTFIRKELFIKIGLYDTKCKIIADWKFFILAILKHNSTYQHTQIYVSICDRQGMSCDPENFNQIAADRNKVLQDNFSPFLIDYNNLVQCRLEYNKLKKDFSKAQHTLGYKIHQKIKKYISRVFHFELDTLRLIK